ncbi:HindIII family type II restriction endonuclease [Segatella buccae]|uniref:HindIII family type II restriction endonuclease n=1 Tax=Segatella buccae TaxID=28126 RepID=UPI0022E52E92|nr:HindIII family type II restriction endonuclease [Segatella buccae]
MDFKTLRKEIIEKSKLDFVTASTQLEELVFKCTKDDILNIITEIGIIPEDIGHDSSEEKLYTKVSDIIFAKALQEMGYEVQVLRERADCADIIAQSQFHSYSLVGDAKAFRLSRTAKNAKDFKVNSMVHWRGDCDYSVLACPYFQYPKSTSQIYKDALDGNVALFSWEILYILLKEDVKETQDICLKEIWNQSAVIATSTAVDKSKTNFLAAQNKNIAKIIGITDDKFEEYFTSVKGFLVSRGNEEIHYYENEIERVKKLSREKAIRELLTSMKLSSKIETIKQFIEQLQK